MLLKVSRMVEKKIWGQLTAIDLHDCKHELLVDRKHLGKFCTDLCDEIDMKPFGSPKIERFGSGYLEGLSAIQFIETSTITVHLDEIDKRAFIDIFSCKEFDHSKAVDFSKKFFKAKHVKHNTIFRGHKDG